MRGGSSGFARPSRNGKASGSNSLPPRARIQPVRSPGVNQAKERDQAAPGAAALLHRVGIARLVFQQLCVQAAHRIALVVEGAGLLVGARRDQVAVFGVEDEDEPHQHRQQPFVEVLRPLGRQGADQLGLSRRQAAEQFVQGADHLLGECRRNRRLRLAARLQQGRQAPVFGIVEQAEAVEHQLQPAEHRPACNCRQRTQRERQSSPRSRRAVRRPGAARYR